MIRQSPSETFSDLFHDMCHIHVLYKLEEKGRSARTVVRLQERSASMTS